jgi:hypothetical protein
MRHLYQANSPGPPAGTEVGENHAEDVDMGTRSALNNSDLLRGAQADTTWTPLATA